MLCSFQSIGSIHKVSKSAPSGISLASNPTPGSKNFYLLTSSISSYGIYSDGATYGGSSVCASDNGQMLAFCRTTLSTNKLFTTTDFSQGLIYERTITPFASSGHANSSAISRNAGTSYGIICVKNFSASSQFMTSSDLVTWTQINSLGLSSSPGVTPDVSLSDDGQYAIISGTNSNNFNSYKSSDYMANWTSLNSLITFSVNSNFMNSSGQRMCFVTNGGNSKVSSDYGSTFSTFFNSTNPSVSLNLTDDFTKGVLGSPGTVRVITSTSSSTFSNQTPKTSTGAQRTCINKSATRMGYVRTETGQPADFYYSTDSGTTFTNINTEYSTSIQFTSCSMSESGNYVLLLSKTGLYMLYLP